MIKVKPGVVFTVLRSEITKLLPTIDRVFAGHGLECVLTCACEAHGSDDPHTHGFALDFRSTHVPSALKDVIRAELASYFDPMITVLHEDRVYGEKGGETVIVKEEHYHIQVRRDLWRSLV